MNSIISVLILTLNILTADKFTKAHLSTLGADVKSDEDVKLSLASLILPLLTSPTNIELNPKTLPAVIVSSLTQPQEASVLTLTPYNPTNYNKSTGLTDIIVFNSTSKASAYINDSNAKDKSSERENTTKFISLEPDFFLPKEMTSMKSFLHCEPEVFEHDYIIVEHRTHANTNFWKRANIGEHAGLKEVCLKPNGLSLTRLCSYNKQKHSAEWEDISNWPRIACMRQTRECILSDKLNDLHEKLLEDRQMLANVGERSQVTKKLCGLLGVVNFKLLPADVHIASQILQEIAAVAKDTELTKDIVRICDRLMSSDHQVLRISANLNATNTILYTFEKYMDALATLQVPTASCANTLKTTATTSVSISRPNEVVGKNVKQNNDKLIEEVKMSYLGVRAHISTNISVFFINPNCANISGIAVYAPLTQQQNHSTNVHIKTNVSHTLYSATVANFRYRFIYMNESVTDLRQEDNLQVAGFLPMRLWQHVSKTLLAKGKEPVIVLKVYAHDALFIDPSLVLTREPFSKILSISIPGYEEKFPEPLSFLLRNRYENMNPSLITQTGTGCGYWNYSSWVNNGVQTNTNHMLMPSIIECRTQHLTQFSFLLGGTYKQADISNDVLITPIHLRALDIISIIGCSLSLLGLLGIWLTAALFKSWRALASTKVLLNLCVALTLQMMIFLFFNTVDMSAELIDDRLYINCILLGAFMQYSILVLFAWMLIIALLQFQRYVTVIGIERPKNYILKSAILAWGIPFIPTILLACIDPSSYIPTEYELQTNTGICYPSGLGLTLGVVVPVTTVVIANFTIFIYVFYSISHTLNQAMQRNEKKIIIKQIRLSVLLFFLLGISWIFGLFSYMQGGIIFSYLFCLTATLQGFVLFVYFVLLDELPRNAWLRLLHPNRKNKADKRTTELQSMTTSTGLESGGCLRETFAREQRNEHRNGNASSRIEGNQPATT